MSLYRGLVSDVADPEGLLRIKARVPALYGPNESDWMWPSIPIAMGVQVPDVGDPVWVMLEGGDRERPVWVGTWRTRPQGGLDPDLLFGGVVSETTYGIAPNNGNAYTVARSDHTHGSPPEPPVIDLAPYATWVALEAHLGTDPHPQYLLDDVFNAHLATHSGGETVEAVEEVMVWMTVAP